MLFVCLLLVGWLLNSLWTICCLCNSPVFYIVDVVVVVVGGGGGGCLTHSGPSVVLVTAPFFI